ncbi:MAG: hypothetical protein GY832_30245, partial [Chloroflexi bacterium]|nr:hypothetical protein [Chloroflexota bacterium]
ASMAMIVVLRGCFFRPATNFSGAHFNRGANALWLGVEWVNEPHDESEIIALADDLQRRQIRDVYVFVSYLRADGEFNPTFAHAAEFIRVLKTAQPDSSVQAWIGLPLAQSGLFSSGYVDLGDPATRQKVAAFCADIVREAGFDGVHLDPEPVPTGDTDVLTLLEQVRSAIGVTRTLSMATRRILPILSDSRLPLMGQMAWRASYYREIAQRVDQIAVMTYDSAMPLSSLYRQWVRFQVIEISRAVDGTGVELLIGLPTYDEKTSTHWPSAEHIASGLQGVIHGLNDAKAKPSTVTGVALYAHWDTDSTEWEIYESLWLGH